MIPDDEAAQRRRERWQYYLDHQFDRLIAQVRAKRRKFSAAEIRFARAELLHELPEDWFPKEYRQRARVEVASYGEDAYELAGSSLSGSSCDLGFLDAAGRERVEVEFYMAGMWSERQVAGGSTLFELPQRRRREWRPRRVMGNHYTKRCSCGADITMAKDENERWQALDSEIPDGAKVYFVLDVTDPQALASRIRPEDAQDALNIGELFCSHFENCPHSDRYSRRNAQVK